MFHVLIIFKYSSRTFFYFSAQILHKSDLYPQCIHYDNLN